MSTGIEVKNYKLKALPNKPIPNAILYIKADGDAEISTYITDINGIPYPLKDNSSSIGVQSLVNIDGTISIIGTDNVKISLSSSLLNIINSALQTGDNISELINDVPYATEDFVNSKIPQNYSKIVYVDTNNPTTATIFDLNNPPAINDNSLKEDVNNLYVGVDASTWVYITTPAGYITKDLTSGTSNFYLYGTTIDSGGDKNTAIERVGTVAGAQGTASNHFVTKAQLDLKEDKSEPSQISIITTTDITTSTTDISGRSQKGKNVIISNGSSAINIVVNGGVDFVSSYVKQGTAPITFVQGTGRTLVQVDSTMVLNGIAGSTATISSFGNIDYLRISNA